MGMQNLKLFPLGVLPEMPGHPKFGLFHLVEIDKSLDPDHKLISSYGGQNMPACKISGHSFHELSGNCMETPSLTSFTKS